MSKKDKAGTVVTENAVYDFMHYCDTCSKAYDFTCSGADTAKCEEDKQRILKNQINRSE